MQIVINGYELGWMLQTMFIIYLGLGFFTFGIIVMEGIDIVKDFLNHRSLRKRIKTFKRNRNIYK